MVYAAADLVCAKFVHRGMLLQDKIKDMFYSHSFVIFGEKSHLQLFFCTNVSLSREQYSAEHDSTGV
jgi:hypothetical protein